MIKLFGYCIINREEEFKLVDGSLDYDSGRAFGILETKARLNPQIRELEASNKSVQKSWHMSKEYAEGLERIIDIYKNKFREAMLLRFKLQNALKYLLGRVDPLSYTEYYKLVNKTPLNEPPPSQFILKESKDTNLSGIGGL